MSIHLAIVLRNRRRADAVVVFSPVAQLVVEGVET